MDRAEGWRVDPNPAAKKELEQKSIKEKKNLEAGCRAERGIWVLGHESQLLTEAHFVLFSTVGNGKSDPRKWKKGSQAAQSHHSSGRRGPAAEGLPPHFCKMDSEQQEKKHHAAQKAPCSPKTASQPVLNHSSRLLGPWAPTFAMQQAGDNQEELPENPGMRLKPEPEASFTLCIFSFRHAGLDFFFFSQLRRQSFNPTKHATFPVLLKTDPQLQRPTPLPKPGETKPRGLTPESYTAPF